MAETKYFRRQTLENLFQQADNYSTIWLEGVSGSGKTIFVQHYYGSKAVWLQLDDVHNHLQIFWKTIASLVYDDYRQKNFEVIMNKEHLHTALDLLCTFFNEHPEQALILDDFQTINNPEIFSSLTYFLQNLSQRATCVIITHPGSKFSLAPLLIKRKVLYLDGEAFILTQKEAQQYAVDILDIQPKDAQLLAKKSEGWIGGLHLLIPTLVEEQTKISLKLAKQYVYEKAESSLSRDAYKFITEASVLPYFTNEILALKYPKINIPELIKMLKDHHVMFVETKEGLRFHQLWQDALREKFYAQNNYEAVILEWIEYARMLDKVSVIFYLALQMKTKSQLMKELIKVPYSFESSKFYSLISVEEAFHFPEFLYHKLFHHYFTIEVEKCHEILAKVETVYDDPRYQLFRGIEIIVFPTTSLEKISTADSDTPFERSTQSLVTIKEATIDYYYNEYNKIIQNLQSVYKYQAIDENIYLHSFGGNILLQAYEEQGMLEEALVIYHNFFKLTKDHPFFHFFVRSYEIAIVGVYLKQYNLEMAAATLEHFEGENMAAVFYESYCFNRAEFLFLSGAEMEAILLVEELLQHQQGAISVKYPQILKHYFLTNRHSTFYDQKVQQFISEYDMATFNTQNARIVRALLYINAGELNLASLLLSTMQTEARKSQNAYKFIETTLLLLSLNNLEEKEAIKQFQEILHYGALSTIFQPFVMFQKQLKQCMDEIIFKQTWKLSSRQLKYYKKIQKFFHQKEILTKREQEILTLIIQGQTNQEIASTLFISLATVKTHLLNIYRKLEVSSRTQAVQKADELSLV